MGQEDFKQFRQSKIQLFSRMKLKNVLPGEWESIYAGEGIEFATIKPFEPGDDLRALDLHTLAQSGEEEIIQRVVERQLRIFIWADLSGSMQRFEEMFFSQKSEIKDIALGLLLFSASNAYSPVGLYAFNKEMRRFFPARSGERHCWEILNWIIEQEYKGLTAAADIRNAISFLIAGASLQSLVFFVSDFQDQAFEGDCTALLRPVAKRFDFVPVIIRDPLEKAASLKRSVSIMVRDSEGDKNAEIYLTPQKLKELQGISARHLFALEQNF
ncbi:MAG: hypothetical protein FJY85_01695, partial [Deltaproteobacteria bacterium]|nr:hypothetical protein [Deltaproteobacteria bacterium]